MVQVQKLTKLMEFFLEALLRPSHLQEAANALAHAGLPKTAGPLSAYSETATSVFSHLQAAASVRQMLSLTRTW